jgi:hypothetical protein
MHLLSYLILFLGLAAASRADAVDLVADLHFPERVEFGMSRTELRAARPTVMGGGRENFGGVDATEMNMDTNGIHEIYTYAFKDEKLGAIQYMRGRPVATNMLADVETTRLFKKLSSSDCPMELRKTVQAGQALNVQQWTMEDPIMKVCLIATTDCTVITFFSPDHFAFEDLFPNASETGKEAKNVSSSIAEKRSVEEYPNGVDRLGTNAPPHTLLITE